MTLKLVAVLALALAAPALASCSSGESKVVSSSGALIISRSESIVERSLSTGEERTLIARPAGSGFLLDASVSIDGSRLVYVVQPPPKVVDGQYDAGSDIWVARRDGSDERLVVEHIQPNQLMRYPQWLDDGSLLAIVQERIAPRGTPIVINTLQRIDIATGGRQTVLEGPLSFALSANRKSFVYNALSQKHAGHTLMTAQLPDASSQQSLEPATPAFNFYASVRYSPDDATVAFVSFDPASQPNARRFVAWGRSPRPAPLLHGPPQDVWLLDTRSGSVRRLAALQEDSPVITWSGSGAYIYALAVGGLYAIDTKSGAFDRIGDGAFHGQIAWVPAVP